MSRKIIDLSMEVSKDMVTFPGISKTMMTVLETHEEYAANIGAAKFGVTSLTAHNLIVISDHAGTHIDSLYHVVPDAPGCDAIPLEYCVSDGVLLDFTDKPIGYMITAADVQRQVKKIGYSLKPLDIVLINTGASRYNTEQRYLVEHCGMTREATLWLIGQGIKVMGIDAPTFDPPIKSMFETQKFWEAHRVMCEKEYYHVENLANFDALPRPFGFTVSVAPVKWKHTTGAPVRAMAIME
ncbi:MAG: cyclase family protein [Peptococcaceae bacterium]|nr:cyclase family protein [Peptococcaceae bacterium]